jgi:hypothetical protein
MVPAGNTEAVLFARLSSRSSRTGRLATEGLYSSIQSSKSPSAGSARMELLDANNSLITTSTLGTAGLLV